MTNTAETATNLVGTEKQIAWATEIRATWLASIDEVRAMISGASNLRSVNSDWVDRGLAACDQHEAQVLAVASAARLIDIRNDSAVDRVRRAVVLSFVK